MANSSSLSSVCRRTACLLALGTLLTSCAGTQRSEKNSPLARAAELQRSAGTLQRDPQRFMVSQLHAAQLAGPQAGRSAQADSILGASTLAVARWAVSNDQAGRPHWFSYQGKSYKLTLPAGAGTVPASALQSVSPASKVRHTLVKNWQQRPGVGTPLVAKWKLPGSKAAAGFVAPRGYLTPVTALLDFTGKSGDSAQLRFFDTTAANTVEYAGRAQPLAADISAPLVDHTRDIKELLLALEGLIDPEVHDATLRMLQPYDPSRIPVVFIHGLMSHPRMWRDVINDLMADPTISSRYQFWVYYYPTGWPIAYSAMRLREDLEKAMRSVGHSRDIVLIGHSMGGLLARMQVVSPGKTFMRATIQPDRWSRFDNLPPDHIAKKSFEFSANPDIERIIFISTPHRGSRLADWSLATWFTKFIHLPSKISSAAVDLIPNLLTSPESYTSVSRLSPSNPVYQVLEKLPIQAPHHSIIGDRGRGDSPESSDGVVPYWSSHLSSAESEVIVPDNHGAFDDPSAIAEIKRILRENKPRH